jgi:hypothetical protein
MFRSTKSFLVRSAPCFFFVFFAIPVHAQILRATSRDTKVEPEIARCALETEIALVPYQLTFAEASCEVPVPLGTITGFCSPANWLEKNCDGSEAAMESELLAMGKRGEIIRRARARVLEILQSDNACSAWFREFDLDPAGTFRSTHFVIEEKGPRYVLGFRLAGQGELFKHPWVASTIENAGRNAIIWLNAYGAFFNGFSELTEKEADGGPVRIGGPHVLRVDWYLGNSLEAQITTLLHELGHIVGRISEDNDSTDGLSGRNTAEVLRHCRPGVRAVTAKSRPGKSDSTADR